MLEKDVLEKPIVIIGAARSGTALLAKILNAHPAVAYLSEPSYVWRRGMGSLPHEMYPASAATPAVADRIRQRFRQMAAERGGSRLVEKTPANCLRLGFVRAVLPDARILHLVRDGREVAVSARKKFEGGQTKISRRTLTASAPGAKRARRSRAERARKLLVNVRRKLRTDSPGADLLYWLPDLWQQALAALGLRRRSVWGPRIPGLRGLLRTHSTLEVAAIQWRTCVEQVLNYREAHPEMPYLVVRYEDLCRHPEETAKEVLAFCELDRPEGLDAILGRIVRSEARSDEVELDADERRLLREQIGDTLRRLGYEV